MSSATTVNVSFVSERQGCHGETKIQMCEKINVYGPHVYVGSIQNYTFCWKSLEK